MISVRTALIWTVRPPAPLIRDNSESTWNREQAPPTSTSSRSRSSLATTRQEASVTRRQAVVPHTSKTAEPPITNHPTSSWQATAPEPQAAPAAATQEPAVRGQGEAAWRAAWRRAVTVAGAASPLRGAPPRGGG